MFETAVLQLVQYAIDKELIEEEDRLYYVNQVLAAFGESDFAGDPKAQAEAAELPAILDELLDEAVKRGIIGDGITEKDLFDTKLMGIFVDRPSHIIRTFKEKYSRSPKEATDWFYRFSGDTNYIRRDRNRKNAVWTTETKYGTIDITINLAKPEKDPKAIAAALNSTAHAYPACQLCWENEGYAGRLDHPARENHRVIPITIDGQNWGFQYSPYGYYNEHCIAFNGKHVPMRIERKTFEKLLDFITIFPHYFLGSNADLPIVGGSILTHDHYQGGHYTFAMERASIRKELSFKGFEDIRAEYLYWPLSTIRLTSSDRGKLTDLAEKILNCWRGYSDEAANVFAETDGVPHNTITPIARMHDGQYQLDLALRNNRTSEEFPMGIYHPHPKYHHIKKENIGLIEVMGLAVLPARLKEELKLVAEGLVNGADLTADERTAKHAEWAAEVKAAHPELNAENALTIVKEETGQVFGKVLECAGVYKMNEEGDAGFMRFVDAVNKACN